MEALTLYVDGFWQSPYALSAFVGLEEKGLPYTVKQVRLNKKEHHAPQYRAHTGRVPALQHGDYWLAESSAIVEYLAETFPFPKYPRLFPEDLRQRGICREVQAFVRSDLMPIREERSTSTLFFDRAKEPLSATARASADRLIKIADGLIAEGKTTLFEAWCIADTDLAVMLQRLVINGDPVPDKLKAFVAAQWSRPSVRKWTERQRPPLEKY